MFVSPGTSETKPSHNNCEFVIITFIELIDKTRLNNAWVYGSNRTGMPPIVEVVISAFSNKGLNAACSQSLCGTIPNLTQHNITYSFIRNCQNAIKQRNKSKRRCLIAVFVNLSVNSVATLWNLSITPAVAMQPLLMLFLHVTYLPRFWRRRMFYWSDIYY